MGRKLVEAYFNKLIQRINSLVSRAEVTVIDDTKKIQNLQLKIDEDDVLDNVERFQDYGFSSNPLPGAEAMTIFKGGRRSHGFIIKVDDRRYRLKALESGEVAIYTDEGDKIHFKRGKKILVQTSELTIESTAKVIINSPNVEVNAQMAKVTSPKVEIVAETNVTMTTPALIVSGTVACSGLAAGGGTPAPGKVLANEVESTGNVKDSTGTMAQMRSTYNAHTHKVGSNTSTTPEGTM